MYAAIDIGSNAVRLAILQDQSVEATVIRTPIRLGSDCFSQGSISEKTTKKLYQALQHYKSIIDDNGVEDYRAVATSALREASNSEEVLRVVEEQSGIKIHLIDGITEGKLIQKAVLTEMDIWRKPHLIMDIGGGSVEFITASDGQIHNVASLKIGTVRLLQKFDCNKNHPEMDSILKYCVSEMSQMEEVKKFCFRQYKNLVFIGTGGNFRRIRKLNESTNLNEPGSPIAAEDIYSISDLLISLNFKQRIERLGLRKDRADVIIPAISLVLSAIETFDLSEIHIPQVGLKDGVIQALKEADALPRSLQLLPDDFGPQS
tara:strand:- start:15166 stop:16119 length:954 start_codon:yes stop_codon:yes gene_type:complete